MPLALTIVLPLARATLRPRATPTARPQASGEDKPPPAVETAEVDASRTEAAIEASAVTKLREQVDAHPDEARDVLRNWLHAA